MKLLVLGHARHGKDTVCGILRDEYGLRFESSSKLLAEVAVRPWLEKHYGITYPSFDTMYEDRVNHRDKWYDACAAYNRDDPARFGRELFEKYDVYCGCRNEREVLGMQEARVYDACWWVDASLRLPAEHVSSNTTKPWMAHWIINNNGNVDNLKHEVGIAYRATQRMIKARELRAR